MNIERYVNTNRSRSTGQGVNRGLRHHVTLFFAALLIGLWSHFGLAATQTNGYWKAGTIEGVDFLANGTPAQQTGTTTNPDVFCESKGNGYVLPRAGQFNIAYLGKPPMTGNNNTMNGADYKTRTTGSLVSEWGAQPSLYTGSGWLNFNYWAAEPYSAANRHNVLLGSPTLGYLNGRIPTTLFYVACVRPIL